MYRHVLRPKAANIKLTINTYYLLRRRLELIIVKQLRLREQGYHQPLSIFIRNLLDYFWRQY